MKLLLYCTKAKPYLVERLPFNEKKFYQCKKKNDYYSLNGKIVAECDYEAEETGQHRQFLGCGYDLFFETDTLEDLELQKKSCLDTQQLANYFNSNADYGEKVGYAIHIKNLNIFDELKVLSDVYKIENVGGMLFTKLLTNVPHNMMRVSINHWDYATYNRDDIRILIPITSQEACNILNHKQDVLVRRNVLKESEQ